MDKNTLLQKMPPAKSIGLLALALFMLIVFLISLGSQIPQLWPLSTTLEEPTSIALFEGKIAVIDQQYTRFTEINDSGTVQTTSSIEYGKRDKEQYTTVLITQEGTYYAVKSIFSDCAYVESEKVYFKKNASNSSSLIYERTYTEEQKICGALFETITTNYDESDILLIARTPNQNSLELVSLVLECGTVVGQRAIPENSRQIAYLSYTESQEACAVTTNSGELYLCQKDGTMEQIKLPGFNFLSHCTWDANGLLYCINEYQHTLICIDTTQQTVRTTLTDKLYYSVGANKNGSQIVCGTENGFEIYETSSFSSEDANTPTPVFSKSGEITYSFHLIVKSLLIWLSIVYLTGCVLFILVRFIRKLLKAREGHKIGKAVTVVSVIFLIIGISIFSSAKFFSFAQENHLNTLEGICQSYAKSLSKTLDSGAAANIASGSEEDNQQAFETLGSALTESSKTYADVNISIQTAATFICNDTIFIVYADIEGYSAQNANQSDELARLSSAGQKDDTERSLRTSQLAQSMSKENIQQFIEEASEKPICKIEENAQATYFTTYRSLTSSDGTVIGVIKLSSNMNNLIVSYQDMCLEMIMIMLSVGGGLVLLILEGKMLIRSIKRRHEEKKKEDGRPEAFTARQLNFWGCLISGFDSSLSVLVAEEMLSAQGVAYTDVLIGLPAALSSLGLFIGSIAYYFTYSRFSARKLTIIGAAGAIALFGCASFAVWNNMFLLFCLFRFGASIFLSMPASITFALPNRATEDVDRDALFDECKVSAISGAALGCLICGYVAQYLGNSAIYMTCSLLTLIVFVLACIYIPKGLVFSEPTEQHTKPNSQSRKKAKKSILRLFVHPSIAMVIMCIILPSMLFNGYKNILFPLFMNDQGLTKSYISTIVATSNVLIFATLPIFMKIRDNFNKWNWTLGVMLFAAAVLAWFSINSSPAWAILSLFLLGMAYRLCSRRSYLCKRSTELGYSYTRTNNAYNVVQQLLSAIRSPILSAIAGLGQTVACLILSGLCIVGGGIFSFATRNSAWRKGKAAPPAEGDAAADTADVERTATTIAVATDEGAMLAANGGATPAINEEPLPTAATTTDVNENTAQAAKAQVAANMGEDAGATEGNTVQAKEQHALS